MPSKLGASGEVRAGPTDDQNLLDDVSLELDERCGCCCGPGCAGGCGCRRGLARTAIAPLEDVIGGSGDAGSATGARDIGNGLATLTLSESTDCIFNVGNNSYEAPLTHENLARHTSTSPSSETWYHYQHNRIHDGEEEEDDFQPGKLYLSPDGDFAPGVDIEDQPLEASLVVEHELTSVSRSRLSEFDSSFSRPSPSQSMMLRQVGTHAQHHYFTHGPLPLLERRVHSLATTRRCACCD